jgi:hypothetical protein
MLAAGSVCTMAAQTFDTIRSSEAFLQSMSEEAEVERLSSTTGCQFVEDYSWYNFISTGATAYKSEDSANSAIAYFSYCQQLSNTNATSCQDSGVYAAIYNNGACQLNADTITSTTIDYKGNAEFSLLYTNTDSSSNLGVEELYVIQHCQDDWSYNGVQTMGMSQGPNGISYYTEQNSKIACPVFTMNALIQFVDQYKFIFGFAFIGLGIFFGILGFKLFQIALFIVVTLAVAFLILFIFYATFLSTNTASWVGWLVLAFAVLLGLLGGFLATKIEKFAGAILAGWGGFLLGVLLNETVMWLANSTVLFWIVNVVCALIFFGLGLAFFDHAICFATSFIGAYMFNKGIGMMAGGFPNIYVLIEQIEAGAIDSIPGVFYAYLAGIIILTIVFTVIQFKFFLKKKQQTESHPYNKLN